MPPPPPPISRDSALVWAIPKGNLIEAERVLSVVAAANTFDFTIAKVLTTIISGNHAVYALAKRGFFSKSSLPHFLNVLAKDERGKEGLDEWLEETGYAQRFVESKIDREMDTLKKKFFLRTADVTPERISGFTLEKDVTAFIERLAPTTKAVVFRAAQSDRAIQENTKKDANIVSKLFNMSVMVYLCSFEKAMLCHYCANQQCAFAHQPVTSACCWIFSLQRGCIEAVN